MDFSLALFIYEYAKQQSAFFSQVVCLAKVYNFCHQVALLGAIHKLHNPISEESGSPPPVIKHNIFADSPLPP